MSVYTFPRKRFPLLFGCFLGLCLLKFGNPPIMEKYVTPPENGYEFLLASPWPIHWAYLLLGGLVLLFAVCWVRNSQKPPNVPRSSLLGSDEKRRGADSFPPQSKMATALSEPTGAPRPNRSTLHALLILPLLWLGWQILGLSQSVDTQLSFSTLKHFTAVLVCFYLGYFGLARCERPLFIVPGLLICLGLVLASGFEQHFGGLAETRQYFFLYLYPKQTGIPPEYIKRLSSTRIFGTLFYPNSLAGILLLLLPASLALLLHKRFTLFTFPARIFLAAALGLAGLACLAWSGSKGGWLIMLLLAVLMLLRLPIPRSAKRTVLILVCLGGLVGFGWKYHAFFQKGATSVGARFDYWRAAIKITSQHPLFGTGAGTFGIPYSQLKNPKSEMARLTHNDYLEQACDGGVIAFPAYTSFIILGLILAWRAVRPHPGDTEKAPDYLPYAVFLGLIGWAAQSFFEFSLYIPALSWTAFALLGCLSGMGTVANDRIQKIVS